MDKWIRTHNRDGVIYNGEFIGYKKLCEYRDRTLSKRPTTTMDNSAGEISEIKEKIDMEVRILFKLIGKHTNNK